MAAERVDVALTGDASSLIKAYSEAMLMQNVFMRQHERNRKRFTGNRSGLDQAVAFQLGQAAKAAGLFGQRLLKMNLKGFGIEMAGITTGLLLMKATLATGRWIAQAWGGTINFLKVSVAGLTAAVIGMVGALAAANREFSQLQMRPFAGGGTSAAAASMRGPLSHGGMQIMGIAATQQMVGTLNRAHPGFASNNGRLINQMSQAVGYDPKAAVAYAQALASSKTSGSAQPVSDFLKSQGFIYSGVAQKAAGMKAENLRGAITSGQLTPTEMGGQEGRLQNSLMGQIKGMLPRMVDVFSTIGGPLLPGLKTALQDIETIFVTALQRMTGTIHKFGLGTFIPGMVAQVQRFADWITKIVVQDLPRLMGVLRSIRDWWMEFWNKAGRWFSDLEDRMKKFEESAATTWQMVRNLFGKFWEFYKERMTQWNDLINANAGAYEGFGDALGGFLVGFLKMVTRFKDAFFEALPQINKFLRFLKDEVFPALGDFAEAFANAFSSALPVIQSMVTALMPLLVMLTGIAGVLNSIPGGGGSAALLGLGFLGMSMRGHRGAGMFMSGMFNPMVGTARSTAQAQSPMYNMGVGANKGRGPMFQPKAGSMRPGMMWGNSLVSGGGMMMASFAAAAGISALGGGNPIAQAASTALSSAAPLFFIPGGYGAPVAGLVGGQLLINQAGQMRGGTQAGMTGGMGATLMAGGMLKLGAMAFPKAAAAIAATGVGLPAVAAVLASAYAIQYMVSKKKGEENQLNYLEDGRLEGTSRAAEHKRLIGLESSRQGIRSKMRAFDVMMADDDRLAEVAKSQDISLPELKKRLREERAGVRSTGLRAIDAYTSAMSGISDITGQTADEVESLADRWGLALHNAGDEVEYFFRLTEKYRTYRTQDGHLAGITQKDFKSTFTGMYGEAVANSRYSENAQRPGTQTQQARQQSAAALQNLGAYLENGGLLTDFNIPEVQDVLRTTYDAFVAAGITGSKQGTQWKALGSGDRLYNAFGEMGYDFDPSVLIPFLATLTSIGETGTNVAAFKTTALGSQMNTLMEGIGQTPWGKEKWGTETKREAAMLTAMQSGDPEGALTLLNLDIHSEATKDAASASALLAQKAREAAYALGLIGDSNLKIGAGVGLPGTAGHSSNFRDVNNVNLDARAPGSQVDATRVEELRKKDSFVQTHDAVMGKPPGGWKIPFKDYWNPWG